MPYFRVVREVEFLVQADGREEADRLAENAVTHSDIQPQLDLRARLGGDFEVVDHWRVGPVLEITNDFGTTNVEDHRIMSTHNASGKHLEAYARRDLVGVPQPIKSFNYLVACLRDFSDELDCPQLIRDELTAAIEWHVLQVREALGG